MKKVININFQGRVVPIEETAYDILKQYVDALRRFFAAEEGKEEIINDIESRIAELFAETLKKGSTCITDEDVNNIINSMGRPEDFEGEEEKVKSALGSDQTQSKQQSYQQEQAYSTTGQQRRLYRDENNKVLGGVCSGLANYFGIDPLIIRIIAVITFSIFFIPYIICWIAIPSTAAQVIGSTRKRLFRDMDEKLIAGVCSGLGHYFGVNVWIPRVLFLIPFLSFVSRWSHWDFFDFPHFLSLSFSPGATILYIILWLILPEAITSADKLEMKGERVDLNSIKQTIQTDMEGFKGRAEKFGNDLKDRAQEIGKEFAPKAQQFGAEAAYAARRGSRGLGGVIATIAKIFAYFILAIVVFSIVATLFGIGVVFMGFLPLKDFIINSGWQNVFAWGSLILTIWVPIIGIITFIIRRIAKLKRNSAIMRYSFLSLWLVGVGCTIGLLASLRNDFLFSNSPVEESIKLTNARVDKMEVRLGGYSKYYHNAKWLDIEPFTGLTDDTVYAPNTRIRIIKSTTDSFQVNILKMSDGFSKEHANQLAEKISYSISQKDSVLSLYKGIAINKTDKFRNQRIIITIAVPVGKRIFVDDRIGWKSNVHIGFDDEWHRRRNWEYNADDEQDWDANKEYMMTEKGLVRINKGKYSYDDDDDDNNYRRNRDEVKTPEELQREIEDRQRELDEKKKELQREVEEKLRKIEEDKRKLEKSIDTTKPNGYRYQKTVTVVMPAKATAKETESSEDDAVPSRFSLLQVAG